MSDPMTITNERLLEIVAGCEDRPVNCRFRLRDEGKPYPRSGCEGCAGSFLNGFRPECLSERAPIPDLTRDMATELLATREALAKSQAELRDVLAREAATTQRYDDRIAALEAALAARDPKAQPPSDPEEKAMSDVVERGAKALCGVWGYNWEDGAEHEITVPTDYGDDTPGRMLFREGCKFAFATLKPGDVLPNGLMVVEVPPMPDPYGWVGWHGGENPVPGRMVDLMRDDRRIFTRFPADVLIWESGKTDIIAYRVIEP